MTLDSVTSSGRRAAEARMLDTFAVRYKGTGTTQDETTGREVPTWPTRFTTPGRVPRRGLGDNTTVVVVATVNVAQQRARLDIPATESRVVMAGDVCECVAASPLNPWMLGRCYRVVDDVSGDQETARRLDVERIDPPWA